MMIFTHIYLTVYRLECRISLIILQQKQDYSPFFSCSRFDTKKYKISVNLEEIGHVFTYKPWLLGDDSI